MNNGLGLHERWSDIGSWTRSAFFAWNMEHGESDRDAVSVFVGKQAKSTTAQVAEALAKTRLVNCLVDDIATTISTRPSRAVL
jgi:hypothetical protein